MKHMNKSVSRVAIVTRTKDRGLLLERAILSVHQQTMQDFVHVIINDAGDPRIVEELVNKHKKLISGRVKIIHNTVSMGMEAASNKAIRSVDSFYVSIHDDDDSWHPDFLKETTNLMDTSGAKGVVVTTDKIDEEIVGSKVKKISQSRWLPSVRTVNLYKQCLDNYATPITFIYRREVFEEIGYYDESLPVAGDWDFALRFLMKFDIEFLVTEHALAYYHHRINATGVNQNSVFVNNGLLHEQKINMLANKYMRDDLESGSFGLGYIINSLRYAREREQLNQEIIFQNVQENTVRVEGHINHTADILVDEIKQPLIKAIEQQSIVNLTKNSLQRFKGK